MKEVCELARNIESRSTIVKNAFIAFYLYKTVVLREPNNSEALFGLARQYLIAGNLTLAGNYFLESYRLSSASMSLGPASGFLMHGILAFHFGTIDHAIKCFEMSLSLEITFEAYYWLGEAYSAKGELYTAIGAFSECIGLCSQWTMESSSQLVQSAFDNISRLEAQIVSQVD
ncbi:MAG: hypothetical protein KR126chlam2_00594 [Chlamydiae bacterium]|nr:hypothetical protein [Chlamydiota bacterium]